MKRKVNHEQWNTVLGVELKRAFEGIKNLAIIHPICNSLKYVASKHKKEFMVDLKPVYRAVSKKAAEIELDRLESKWGQKHPIVLRSWRKSGEIQCFEEMDNAN